MNILPLAYTKLKAFETCPRQGFARYVSREYPFAKTEAMEKGTAVHEAFEDRIKHAVPFDPDMLYCEQFIPHITDSTTVMEAELELGITRDNEPCNFSDPECYFRGKIDLLNVEGDTAFIIDWKTGKPYEDSDELHLHAMLAKAHYPEPKHWRGLYVWLRERRVGNEHILSPGRTYHKLVSRVEKLKIEDKPKRNPLCPWCELMSCELNPRR